MDNPLSSRLRPIGQRLRVGAYLAVVVTLGAFAHSSCIEAEGDGARFDPAAPPSLPATEARALPVCQWAEVVDITDGDTIRVEIDGERERVRYIGVDTPELHPQEGPPEPLAEEAASANAWLLSGKRVCLEKDVSETDRYGRLLRYAWLPDGRMVNEVLVAAGLAEVRRYRPDVRHHEAILAPAQEQAIAAGRGKWGQ